MDDKKYIYREGDERTEGKDGREEGMGEEREREGGDSGVMNKLTPFNQDREG